VKQWKTEVKVEWEFNPHHKYNKKSKVKVRWLAYFFLARQDGHQMTHSTVKFGRDWFSHELDN